MKGINILFVLVIVSVYLNPARSQAGRPLGLPRASTKKGSRPRGAPPVTRFSYSATGSSNTRTITKKGSRPRWNTNNAFQNNARPRQRIPKPPPPPSLENNNAYQWGKSVAYNLMPDMYFNPSKHPPVLTRDSGAQEGSTKGGRNAPRSRPLKPKPSKKTVTQLPPASPSTQAPTQPPTPAPTQPPTPPPTQPPTQPPTPPPTQPPTPQPTQPPAPAAQKQQGHINTIQYNSNQDQAYYQKKTFANAESGNQYTPPKKPFIPPPPPPIDYNVNAGSESTKSSSKQLSVEVFSSWVNAPAVSQSNNNAKRNSVRTAQVSNRPENNNISQHSRTIETTQGSSKPSLPTVASVLAAAEGLVESNYNNGNTQTTSYSENTSRKISPLDKSDGNWQSRARVFVGSSNTFQAPKASTIYKNKNNNRATGSVRETNGKMTPAGSISRSLGTTSANSFSSSSSNDGSSLTRPAEKYPEQFISAQSTVSTPEKMFSNNQQSSVSSAAQKSANSNFISRVGTNNNQQNGRSTLYDAKQYTVEIFEKLKAMAMAKKAQIMKNQQDSMQVALSKQSKLQVADTNSINAIYKPLNTNTRDIQQNGNRQVENTQLKNNDGKNVQKFSQSNIQKSVSRLDTLRKPFQNDAGSYKQNADRRKNMQQEGKSSKSWRSNIMESSITSSGQDVQGLNQMQQPSINVMKAVNEPVQISAINLNQEPARQGREHFETRSRTRNSNQQAFKEVSREHFEKILMQGKSQQLMSQNSAQSSLKTSSNTSPNNNSGKEGPGVNLQPDMSGPTQSFHIWNAVIESPKSKSGNSNKYVTSIQNTQIENNNQAQRNARKIALKVEQSQSQYQQTSSNSNYESKNINVQQQQNGNNQQNINPKEAVNPWNFVSEPNKNDIGSPNVHRLSNVGSSNQNNFGQILNKPVSQQVTNNNNNNNKYEKFGQSFSKKQSYNNNGGDSGNNNKENRFGNNAFNVGEVSSGSGGSSNNNSKNNFKSNSNGNGQIKQFTTNQKINSQNYRTLLQRRNKGQNSVYDSSSVQQQAFESQSNNGGLSSSYIGQQSNNNNKIKNLNARNSQNTYNRQGSQQNNNGAGQINQFGQQSFDSQSNNGDLSSSLSGQQSYINNNNNNNLNEPNSQNADIGQASQQNNNGAGQINQGGQQSFDSQSNNVGFSSGLRVQQSNNNFGDRNSQNSYNRQGSQQNDNGAGQINQFGQQSFDSQTNTGDLSSSLSGQQSYINNNNNNNLNEPNSQNADIGQASQQNNNGASQINQGGQQSFDSQSYNVGFSSGLRVQQSNKNFGERNSQNSYNRQGSQQNNIGASQINQDGQQSFDSQSNNGDLSSSPSGQQSFSNKINNNNFYEQNSQNTFNGQVSQQDNKGAGQINQGFVRQSNNGGLSLSYSGQQSYNNNNNERNSQKTINGQGSQQNINGADQSNQGGQQSFDSQSNNGGFSSSFSGQQYYNNNLNEKISQNTNNGKGSQQTNNGAYQSNQGSQQAFDSQSNNGDLSSGSNRQQSFNMLAQDSRQNNVHKNNISNNNKNNNYNQGQDQNQVEVQPTPSLEFSSGPIKKPCTVAPVCGSDGFTYMSECFIWSGATKDCDGFCPCQKPTTQPEQKPELFQDNNKNNRQGPPKVSRQGPPQINNNVQGPPLSNRQGPSTDNNNMQGPSSNDYNNQGPPQSNFGKGPPPSNVQGPPQFSRQGPPPQEIRQGPPSSGIRKGPPPPGFRRGPPPSNRAGPQAPPRPAPTVDPVPDPQVADVPPACNCPDIYRPVCSIAGNTYDNDCLRRCNYDGFKCQGRCPCGKNSIKYQANDFARPDLDPYSPLPTTTTLLQQTTTVDQQTNNVQQQQHQQQTKQQRQQQTQQTTINLPGKALSTMQTTTRGLEPKGVPVEPKPTGLPAAQSTTYAGPMTSTLAHIMQSILIKSTQMSKNLASQSGANKNSNTKSNNGASQSRQSELQTANAGKQTVKTSKVNSPQIQDMIDIRQSAKSTNNNKVEGKKIKTKTPKPKPQIEREVIEKEPLEGNGQAQGYVQDYGPTAPVAGEGASACHCNNIYAPVCGTDGITYTNPCDLTCSGGARTACNGECPCDPFTFIEPVYFCEDYCSRTYQPVCSMWGRTYDNDCLRKCSNEDKDCNGECPCPAAGQAVYDPQPTQYGQQPAQYDPQPAVYDHQPALYDPAPYDTQVVQQGNQQAAYDQTQYAYDPAPAQYGTQSAHYDPAPAQYGNQPGHYDPAPAQYGNQPGHYDASPVQYGAQSAHYDPAPAQYGNQPGQYDPVPASYGNQPGHYDPAPVANINQPPPYNPHQYDNQPGVRPRYRTDPNNFNAEPSNQPVSTCECVRTDVDPVCSIHGETLWYGCDAICRGVTIACSSECPC